MSAVLDPSTTTALAERPPAEPVLSPSAENWKLVNRQAQALASSTLVPETYRGNVANCLIALEMANRMGASPLLVMQNLYVVHGNPSWSAKFLIATFNANGRFSALRYEWNADRTSCRAWAIEKATGDRLDGPMVSVEMAKAEGWSSKNGSKWKTMPELMLMYRSATFFVRTYAPELSMGLQTTDELDDIVQEARSTSISAVRAALDAPALPSTPAPDGPAVDATAPVLQNFIDDVDNAPDAEMAQSIVDAASSVLSDEDMAVLREEFRRAWQE